ncbi:hypothetical protein Pcinc_023286 [Petrolisthes cinctipes]|uniref:RNase H type-1 domain-containing protein n=1 Tax=Petrolisthes cinctipes TaxID=88211 RepID=A0AAE1KFH9_PETCI|nr:hypothetical protein Pcinc_023286 [Petrolisthes cinctipes]
MDQATISTKRRMELDSDSSSESPSPLAKSSKSNKTPLVINTLEHHLPRPANQRTSTMPPPATPAFAPRGHNIVKVVSDNLRGPNFNIPEQAAVPDLPPWRVPLPTVTLTPTSKNVHPPLQKQLALETIASVSTSVPAAHHIYVDGSVQADGRAACAMFSPTMEPPVQDEWIGRRLPNSSSSTYCEFHAILDAVTLLVQRRKNGVIISDSQSALQALSSPRPVCSRVVRDILCQLAHAHDVSLVPHWAGWERHGRWSGQGCLHAGCG